MIPFEYHLPSSLEETFALLGQHGDDGKLIAGGTALVILMKQRLVRPSALISLSRVPRLHGVEASNGGLRIGALTTHREAETDPLLRERAAVLADTLHHVATIRIRNVGTVGGNLAHADPNQDPPVTLIALGASVELASQGGTRQVAVEEFFTDYYETALQAGEVLTAIHVPGVPAGAGAVYHKFLPRTADDYATVSVAAVVSLAPGGGQITDLRVALGSVGSTPIRARAVESALRGQAPSEANFREAAHAVLDEVDPISDVRGSAEYKRDMAEVWVRRALTNAVAAARG